MNTQNKILYSAVGFLWAVMALSGYYFVIAQETPQPELIEPVAQPTETKYDDGKTTDSFVEKIKKSATSTPENDDLYIQDQILEKLNNIENLLRKGK